MALIDNTDRRGRPSPERPLDLVELQALRAYQRALRAHREMEHAVRRASTESAKRHAQHAATAARGIRDKMLLELDAVLVGDGA